MFPAGGMLDGDDESIDDSCSEKSSSTSTSTNQNNKDGNGGGGGGKYCDCCYCEFFGHTTVSLIIKALLINIVAVLRATVEKF